MAHARMLTGWHLWCARRYRQAELVHARWAMLAVAGILAQEIVKPGVFFYNAGLPENLPGINFGGPEGKVGCPAQGLRTEQYSI